MINEIVETLLKESIPAYIHGDTHLSIFNGKRVLIYDGQGWNPSDVTLDISCYPTESPILIINRCNALVLLKNSGKTTILGKGSALLSSSSYYNNQQNSSGVSYIQYEINNHGVKYSVSGNTVSLTLEIMEDNINSEPSEALSLPLLLKPENQKYSQCLVYSDGIKPGIVLISDKLLFCKMETGAPLCDQNTKVFGVPRQTITYTLD